MKSEQTQLDHHQPVVGELTGAAFELVLQQPRGLKHDRVLVIVQTGEGSFSGSFALRQVARIWRRLLIHAKRCLARISVLYAGQTIASFEIVEQGGVYRRTFTHLGGRVHPGSFSVREELVERNRHQTLRTHTTIIVELRAETEAELLSHVQLPERHPPFRTYPGIHELVSIRAALSRE